MTPLDARGIIAVVQTGLYVPIAVISGFLFIRYGLRRDAGWLFLFIFALTRVTDGALILSGELAKTPMDLLTPAYTMQAAGLAPLMLASLGFIGLVGQSTFSDYPRFSHILRFLSLLDVVAFAFAIAGALLGSSVAPTSGATGYILRRVGACVFASLYLLIVFAHFVALSYRWHLKAYRRRLLAGLFLALPFLGARSAYAVLASWSSSDPYGRQLSDNRLLADANPVTGKYPYFLALSVVCEVVVAVIYLVSSTILMRKP